MKRTFGECEQIVVPLTVSMGAEVLTVRPVHNPDISPNAVNHGEEGISTSIDGSDDLWGSPSPISTSEIRDAFVLTETVQLVDASNLTIRHGRHLVKVTQIDAAIWTHVHYYTK
jgi:hypothetical protein